MAAAASTTELILDEVFHVCVSKFVCLSVVSDGMSIAVFEYRIIQAYTRR